MFSLLIGFVLLFYCSVYNVSKYVLYGLFDILWMELEGIGVSVILVCLGFIVIDLCKNVLVGDGLVIC